MPSKTIPVIALVIIGLIVVGVAAFFLLRAFGLFG